MKQNVENHDVIKIGTLKLQDSSDIDARPW